MDVMLRRTHAAAARLARVVGQAPRLLEQVARRVPRAARACVRRGVLQRRGDLLVGSRGGEREVARSLLGVRDELREPGVHPAPLGARRRRIDGGSVQRVRERHAATVDVQQPRAIGGVQAGRR